VEINLTDKENVITCSFSSKHKGAALINKFCSYSSSSSFCLCQSLRWFNIIL